MGAGIGTITHLLIHHPVAIGKIVSTENNQFCLQALKENIGKSTDQWTLVPDLPAVLELGFTYDLIIIDGILDDARGYAVFQNGVVCFVEGIRKEIRDALINHLASRPLTCQFTSYIRPPKLRFSKKRLFGLIPKLKYQTKKGCHIARIAN